MSNEILDRLYDRLDREKTLSGRISDNVFDLLPCSEPDSSVADSFVSEGASENPANFPPGGLTGGVNRSFSGGYDGGIEVSLFGDWFPGDDDNCSAFFRSLELAKHSAREKTGDYKSGNEFLTLGGREWVVSPYGTSGSVCYSYQLRSEGVVLLIHNNGSDRIPALRVKYEFDSLWGRDLQCVHYTLLEYLREIGFVFNREVLSRIDLQVTLNLDIDFVHEALSDNRIVSRVKRWTTVVSPQGKLKYLRGGTDLQICIYDKSDELVSTNKFDKSVKIYSQFKDLVDLSLTRVEFRFRRESLKVFGLNTIDEFYRRIADVVDYLTGDWFRILASSKVRGCESSQKISPEWALVRKAFRSVFVLDRLKTAPLHKDNSVKVDYYPIFRQALGCLSSAYSIDRSSVLSYEEFCEVVLKDIYRQMPGLYADYRRKLDLNRVLKGC